MRNDSQPLGAKEKPFHRLSKPACPAGLTPALGRCWVMSRVQFGPNGFQPIPESCDAVCAAYGLEYDPATATLVVDQTRPDPVSAAAYQGNPSPAFMATQVDILKSDRIAQRVLSNLHLADDPKAREEWMRSAKGAGTLESWLVEDLQFKLDVKPSRESNVISVSYKSSDSVKAAKMANAFVQAYLDVSLGLKVDPAKQYSTFFDNRSK